MALSYKVNVTTGTQVAAGNPEVSATRVEEYLYNQTGLLSSIGGGQALGPCSHAFQVVQLAWR